MNLASKDVDTILYSKLMKKVTFWHTYELSLARKATIVTSILASTL